MNSLTPDEADECSFCGKRLITTTSEKWRAPSGQPIAVPKSDVPYIFAETSKGEICLCEECYKKKNFEDWNPDDLAEIHYQFGLEYRESGYPSESVNALHQGLQLRKTADMLAAIALSYSEIGDQKLEQEFYLQALALDPNHFAANENIKRGIE